MSEKWTIGEKIEGRYEIHFIKKGGMGIVFLCYDHEERMPVAIKTFQDKYLIDNDSVERFIHEANVWIDLGKHKNIVRAYYVKNIHHRPYIFLEYIVGDEYYGVDLSGWIARKGVDLKTTLYFAIQFCDGMIHAEKKFNEIGKPFVHRDIKPANIMITRDKTVKITDFGLVKTFVHTKEDINVATYKDEFGTERLGFSKVGSICGTPPYMSPEQCRGDAQIDVRSDIYAFGCVMYEMLTGKPPFICPDFYTYMAHHLEVSPKPIKKVNLNIPGELDDIVMKCLRKNPTERYQEFKILRKELADLYFQITGEVIKEETTFDYIDAEELNLRGLSLDNLGKYQDAIECFNKALEINVDQRFRYVLYSNRGRAYESMGQFDKALEDYGKAIDICPSIAIAYCNRANVYSNIGQLATAMKDYGLAIELDPNYASAFYNRGLCHYRLGNLNDALQDFNKAIELGFTDAYTNRGSVYYALGQLDRALFDFNKAIEINPRDVVAYTNRATIYGNLGEVNKALVDYSKAIEINSFYILAYYNRGNLFCRLGQFQKAIEDYNKVLNINPQDIPKIATTKYALSEAEITQIYLGTYFNLGVTYVRLNRAKEAIKYFKKFLEIAPSDYVNEMNQVRMLIHELEKQI